jgi:antitoxin YefM
MLSQHLFTEARSKFTTIVDHVQNLSPQVIRRRKKTETDVLLITTELQKQLLAHLSFIPEVLTEDDGSVTLALDTLELYVNQPTVEAAYQDLADDLIGYAQDYMKNRVLYLNSSNRNQHFPYVLRILLCDSKEEVVQLMKEHGDKNSLAR